MLLILSLLAARAGTLDVTTATGLATTRALDATDAELALLQQEIALREARLAWTPDVTARLGSQGSLGRTFSEQLGANVTEPVVSLSGSLSASMPLYQGGSLIAERRAAEASTEAARKTRLQTLRDLQWMAIDGLIVVDQARDALTVQRATLEAEVALLEQVGTQLEAGAETPADRYAQESAVASRRAAVAAAQQTLRNAELDLLTLLRLDPSDAWTFAPAQAGPILGADGRTLASDAMEARADLAAAVAQIDAARETERAARGDWFPSVSLGAGASTSWLSSRDATFGTQLEDQSRAWVSLDVSFPVLNGGARQARIENAAVSVRAAELAEQRLRDQITLDVHRLLAARTAAEAAVEASAVAAESARQAVRVRELRYRTGAETLVSLTEARADLVDAELALARTDAELQRVRYELAWVTGRIAD